MIEMIPGTGLDTGTFLVLVFAFRLQLATSNTFTYMASEVE